MPNMPDIVHAFQREKWEQQTAFVNAWWLEMWKRTESDDKKAAKAVQPEEGDADNELDEKKTAPHGRAVHRICCE